MIVTKELMLHDDVMMRVTVKNYLQITKVILYMKKYDHDKELNLKFELLEPFGRFINAVIDCKEYGHIVAQKE